jgi:heme/copper-type cytochrome/quinol oxidase subunit 1
MTRRARWTSRIVLGAGLAVTSAGIVVVALATAQPATFGWFAYAPLSDTTFTAAGLHVFSTATLVGAGLVIVGLLVLAAWCGYRRGVRHR